MAVLILASEAIVQVLVVGFFAESVESSSCAVGAVVPMPTLPAFDGFGILSTGVKQ